MASADLIHGPMLREYGFVPMEDNGPFCPLGVCYRMDPSRGNGYYWIYYNCGMFAVVIHDFVFYEDFFLECRLPEYLSITYYESISGEEISPYRRLNAGVVRGFYSGKNGFQALIHKNIPVRSVGIEIMPEYYEQYLRSKYQGEYTNPCDAFESLSEDTVFPQMRLLLNQVGKYRGQSMAAKLFYEAKVAEAVSLIVERTRSQKLQRPLPSLSAEDERRISSVTAYINDHCAFDLRLEQLCRIACMGTTKLKLCFKVVHRCTITEYIQNRRMGQAEHLLTQTDFTIGQIARIVGYDTPGRFSELFRRSTGLLPSEYRGFTR